MEYGLRGFKNLIKGDTTMNLDDIFKCISCKEKFEHRYCSEHDVAYCHSCYQLINDEKEVRYE